MIIMRKVRLYHRSTATIVQQENGQTTRDILKGLSNGQGVDLNPGSQSRSFDCDSQRDVDFDKPIFEGFEDLMDQHLSKDKIYEHLHPQAPKDPPTPPADPPTPKDPPTPPAD